MRFVVLGEPAAQSSAKIILNPECHAIRAHSEQRKIDRDSCGGKRVDIECSQARLDYRSGKPRYTFVVRYDDTVGVREFRKDFGGLAAGEHVPGCAIHLAQQRTIRPPVATLRKPVLGKPTISPASWPSFV